MTQSQKDVPANPAKWAELAEKEGILNQLIHEEKLFSASKITLRQYLLLRVLRKKSHRTKLNPKQLGLEPWMNQAKDMLQSYPSWNTYRESFKGKHKEGNFFLVQSSQAEAAKVKSNEVSNSVMFSPVSKHTRQRTRERERKERREPYTSPTKSNQPSLEQLTLEENTTATEPVTPGNDEDDDIFTGPPSISTGGSLGPEELLRETYPPVDDEQIVNVALVNFLQALTDYFPYLGSSWTIHRKSLKAKFNDAEYEARTDGYLRGKVDGEVRALIEVKAALRRESRLAICMQEGAQIVAWLKSHPQQPGKLPFRRFQVSQDRHEIWLSFAEYDDEYLRYIEHGFQDPERPRSFLTMHEFGPFDTRSESHMTELAVILLALTLRADHDRKEEQESNPFDN
ncbi:hypothetical protein AtubIFM54640_010071 [Aspergillus tubingensis]|uniref:Uncharacterized protein n=1 Tax=Aspergillus tubingensis (strain CBS 134.48) TaxID=767770 RepID=A0A1L9MSD7_ASPTC|nr:phosphotransferase enzyme family protein [Aspergillus tubingensis]OJI79795.1 hypothetical protein ASPTUDRAFT_34041 [Aspergillus tubingensis CBS 134.48]GFN12324.1 phosphotransferase enzyme family protein [Aspergillus tubingensis]GLA67095.1 hypothetical protein AtubIFM54640_010071 [Aspergillus tubingensis]GLB19966.1 hypothetical protein AtubIFM61612_009891 [Aspergillus tubingensis]